MTDMVDQIRGTIQRVLKELGLPQAEFSVEHPAEERFGDYSSNVAMAIFSQIRNPKSEIRNKSKIQKSKFKNPRELAELIAEKLRESGDYEKIEVAGPGFINISINSDYFVSELGRVLKSGSNYGKGELWQGKKVAVEYTDPNPFKEFHIGHLYNTSVGETLARLFEAQGAIVWRADFFGDVGMHAAKAIYGLFAKLKIDNGKLKIDETKWKELEEKPLPERVKVMGQAYAMGATAYEEDEKAKEEMKQLNLLIFVAAQEHWQETKGWKPRVDYRSHVKQIDEVELSEIKKMWVIGRQWSLDYFETLYERLGTKLDGYYPESLSGEWGYDFVMEGVKKGVFEESEGAIVCKGEKYGFHTRVFINKLKLPTYETKDIGLAPYKYSEFPYDKSLIVTANEINEYFKVVIAAMKDVNPDLGNKTEHLGHGMVRLPEGKMSSRTGKIVTGEWLLDEAKGKVSKIMKEEDDKVADMIAVAAVKYAFLKSGIGKDIAFTFDESVSFEGNSGPYLQYTYARCRSVMRRAEKSNYELRITNYEFNEEEMAVLRWIPRYGEVVEQACKEYAPNHVCTYLFELAQRYNTFYNKHSILGKTQNGLKAKSLTPNASTKHLALSIEQRALRLALTGATAQVIENGLGVLGIKVPRKM